MIALVLADSLLRDCPPGVWDVLNDLSRDATVLSIWLIGSRADGSARADSDWDFLVFSSMEPTCVTRRQPDVDVIRVGPTCRRALADGEDHLLDFQDFSWLRLDNERASYVGKKFRAYGAVRDQCEPVFARGASARNSTYSRSSGYGAW